MFDETSMTGTSIVPTLTELLYFGMGAWDTLEAKTRPFTYSSGRASGSTKSARKTTPSAQYRAMGWPLTFMTKATMEARLTWLVKPVRPVTMISWGGEWVMETKVLLLDGLGSGRLW